MRRSELLQGIREMRFISVYKRFSGGEITQQVAADLLGISDRTFRRWAERFGDEGSGGPDRPAARVICPRFLARHMSGMFVPCSEGDERCGALRYCGHGLFGSLYTDRGSHYFLTQSAGGKVDKTNLTQAGRALAQLGIRHIPSYSPEARGRMERAFGTLQGRAPQELRLHGLTTKAAANVYLREVFMADFNARFGVAAAEPGTAFVAYAGGPVEDILCQQLDRQVGRDNCVSWRGRSLQVPPQAHRHHSVRATIRVHEYPDGRLALFDGPRCLARYAADATPTDHPARDAA